MPSLAAIRRSTSTDGGVDGFETRLAGRILDRLPLGEEGMVELEDIEAGAELGRGLRWIDRPPEKTARALRRTRRAEDRLPPRACY